MLWPPLGRLPIKVRGRDDIVQRLTRLLSTPDGRAHVLTGLGGTGKSAVALQVADVALTSGLHVWWVSAVDENSLKSSLLDLAQTLGADPEQVKAARSDLMDPSDLLWVQLENTSDWLLVIDNADDMQVL